MTEFIASAIRERQLGLALHYPFIHAAVVGLHAQRTYEFGAGGSTRVFLDALATTGGLHRSVSTERREDLVSRYGLRDDVPWQHWSCTSGELRKSPVLALYEAEDAAQSGMLDMVLHDGSHAASEVVADIASIWPFLKRYGLLLVHDVEHSYCGAEVRDGLRRGLVLARAKFSATVLSYGFGLAVIRKENEDAFPVEPAPAKLSSPHTTQLVDEPFFAISALEPRR